MQSSKHEARGSSWSILAFANILKSLQNSSDYLGEIRARISPPPLSSHPLLGIHIVIITLYNILKLSEKTNLFFF